MDGTRKPLWMLKKQPFRKYLKNYSIYFPNCFCAPQKSFEDIFWNVPNWKNLKFFQYKNFELFFLRKKHGCVEWVVWSIFRLGFKPRKGRLFDQNFISLPPKNTIAHPITHTPPKPPTHPSPLI